MQSEKKSVVVWSLIEVLSLCSCAYISPLGYFLKVFSNFSCLPSSIYSMLFLCVCVFINVLLPLPFPFWMQKARELCLIVIKPSLLFLSPFSVVEIPFQICNLSRSSSQPPQFELWSLSLPERTLWLCFWIVP